MLIAALSAHDVPLLPVTVFGVGIFSVVSGALLGSILCPKSGTMTTFLYMPLHILSSRAPDVESG